MAPISVDSVIGRVIQLFPDHEIIQGQWKSIDGWPNRSAAQSEPLPAFKSGLRRRSVGRVWSAESIVAWSWLISLSVLSKFVFVVRLLH